MLLHASITADRPQETAQTLARIMGGLAIPMGPGVGTWMAAGPDPMNSIIEVLVRGAEFHRDPGKHVTTRQGQAVRHSGFHVLIDSPLEEEEIMAIASDAGVPAHRASNGLFELIEFWIDGCTLLEIITPSLSRAYRALFEPERLAEFAKRIPDG